MAEINKEIGLEEVLQGMGMGRSPSSGDGTSSDEDEKRGEKSLTNGHSGEAKEIEAVG